MAVPRKWIKTATFIKCFHFVLLTKHAIRNCNSKVTDIILFIGIIFTILNEMKGYGQG